MPCDVAKLKAIWADVLGVWPHEEAANFFEAGGNSLDVIQLLSRLRSEVGVEYSVKDFFADPTLGGLIAGVGRSGEGRNVAVEAAGQRSEYPVTIEQQDMWLLQQLDPAGNLFNITMIVSVDGQLRADVLEKACNVVIDRHPALRTGFAPRGGVIMQQLCPHALLRLSVSDCETEADVKVLADRLGRAPFDLSQPPLLRGQFVRVGAARCCLILVVHHLVVDGWGLEILLKELAAAYEGLAAGREPLLTEQKPLLFGDYAIWQKRRLEAGDWQEQQTYWRAALKGVRPMPALRCLAKVPGARRMTTSGGRYIGWLDRGLVTDLQGLGHEAGASLFMVLTAVYHFLLHRYSGSADVVSGTAVAKRNRVEFEGVVGCFINALALRSDFSGDRTFSELLSQVRETVVDAFDNQDVPYLKVIQDVNQSRPVFRHELILQNVKSMDKFAGLPVHCDEIGNGTAKLDLLIYAEPKPEGLKLICEYSTDLFDEAAMACLVEDFASVIRQVADDRGLMLSAIRTRRRTPVRPSCFVVGETLFAWRCLEALLAGDWHIKGVITPLPEVRRLAEQHGLAVFSLPKKGQLSQVLMSCPYDYLFSIVNSSLLPEDVLKWPRMMAINWHDGPLPRYAGVHATAWALMNGERKHGVTWHKMVGKVDAGGILRQRLIDIQPDDTSFTLNARCHECGLEEFQLLLADLENGAGEVVEQSADGRSYYGLYERPAGGCLIDWRLGAEAAGLLCRALDFGNVENPLGLPKVYQDGQFYVVSDLKSGRLLTLDGGATDVALRQENDPGFSDVFSKLSREYPRLARVEMFWVRRLESLQMPDLPIAAVSGADEYLPAVDPTLFLAFLARLTGQENFDVGMSVDPVVAGFFSETVPLRVEVKLDESLQVAMASVQCSLDLCRQRGTYARDVVLRYARCEENPDYNVVVVEDGGIRVRGAIGLGGLYERFCQGRDDTLSLREQIVLDEAGEQRLLKQNDAVGEVRGPDECVHWLFEQQCVRTPEAAALATADRVRTYDQLNGQSGRLASLLQQRGVGPGVAVGIYVPRSLEMVVAVMAVLKAGGAFVPLDPEYPEERLKFIVDDTSMPLVLAVTSTFSTSPLNPDGTILVDDESAYSDCSVLNGVGCPDDAAYILYTSGSTGQPKGVVVEHRQIVNHCLASLEHYGISGSDRVLQFFSLNFDGAMEEIFPALSCGGTVVLRPEELSSSISAFVDFVAEHRITVVDLPTAYWHEWVRAMDRTGGVVPSGLRAVIVGGEKVSAGLYRIWRAHGGDSVRWFNTYGPTECTVVSTIYEGAADLPDDIPIGKAIARTLLYVVDSGMRLVPEDVPGELLIGGAGVAREYWNRDDLTAQKFIANPFGPGRVYRTGDLVVRLPDGSLAFRGRIDDQIKIRGFRIEPGEIARVLEGHPAVRSALVMARDDMGPRKMLAAYVIQSGGLLDEEDLAAFTRERLPEYMVPSAFVVLPEFPVTPNGKVDRKALPVPALRGSRKDGMALPVTRLEEGLVEIWKEVLGIPRVDVTESFFQIGGHSLLAVRLCAEYEARFGKPLPLPLLFRHPTVRGLARQLEEASNGGTADAGAAVTIQAGEPDRLPLFFVHVLGSGLKFCLPLVKRLGRELPVYGLSVHFTSSKRTVENSVPALAAAYIRSMRAIQPQGPYQLTGVSFGGIVAWEMVRQLREQGETVRVLALLDTIGPGGLQTVAAPVRFRRHWARLVRDGLGYVKRQIKSQIRNLERLGTLVRFQAAVGCALIRQRFGWSLSADALEILARWENKVADSAYAPAELFADVLLFRSLERSVGVAAQVDPHLGWGPLVKGELTVYEVSSDHLGMLEEPYVAVLADYLRPHLEDGPHE